MLTLEIILNILNSGDVIDPTRVEYCSGTMKASYQSYYYN